MDDPLDPVNIGKRRASMTASTDTQRDRAARNQSLFRAVNEQIEAVSTGFEKDMPQQYVCECLDLACSELIFLPHEEYARIRRHANEFVILPGHEDLQVEEVVAAQPRWLIVRKLGVGATVAAELAE
jgi:hypothetical protein